jgi:hypothetical protein
LKEVRYMSEPKSTGKRRAQRQRRTGRRTVRIDYLTAKLEGGAKPTAEAYMRAVAQWQNLPGAVRSTPPPVVDSAKQPTENSSASAPETGGPS